MNFHGADLRDLDLVDAYLAVADLDGVNLAGADLDRATLLGTKLKNADLSGAYLHKAEADGCEAEVVNLSGAPRMPLRPTPTRLSEAQLSGAKVADSRGEVRGPVLVDNQLLAGRQLEEWFAAMGALELRVVE